METYRNNISKKFKEIKDQFNELLNNSNKKKLLKINSHSSFINRPRLGKLKHNSIDKVDLNHMLDQIGNDDTIFNNDKLLTNIKIESFENPIKKHSICSVDNDRPFISKKNNKNKSTSNIQRTFNNNLINKRKVKGNNKITNSYSNKNKLELNCNKMLYTSDNNNKSNIVKKKLNRSSRHTKNNLSQNKNKNVCVKNVDQFINKPNDTRKTPNKNCLMTPISNKSTIIIQKNKKLISKMKNNEFQSSQRSFININNNDTISLASTSRMDMSKSFIRGRSMPTVRANKSQSNLHLPNKSIIKNQDKIIMELQKLFGEKIQLNEEIYQNMTELDIKNTINFLLETVKELNNINKVNKTKTDGYKQIIESKENQIKQHKNEIKELKKENLKLNKIIKTNNQLNKKLSQNIENLKLQLEKEKAKIKNMQTRGKSTSNKNNIYSNKYKNENNINKNRKIKENKSQDKIRKANGFINRRKSETSCDKKKENIENKENNKNNNIKDNIEVNITWKNNEDKKTDITPNPLIIIDPKEQNDVQSSNKNNLIN